jgi:hypothetical protein
MDTLGSRKSSGDEGKLCKVGSLEHIGDIMEGREISRAKGETRGIKPRFFMSFIQFLAGGASRL